MIKDSLSISEFNSIISVHRSLAKRSDNSKTINYNSTSSSTNDTQENRYKLINVEFSENTRNSKIEFEEEKAYKTIERYVTRNYVKYPIYSDWKCKYKVITKRVKLTNKQLESLNKHEDKLIYSFAKEIILFLDNDDLLPSWLLKRILSEKSYEERKNRSIELATAKQNQKNIEQTLTTNYKNNEEKVVMNKKFIKIKTNKLDKKTNKLAKIINYKKNIFLSIVSFGVYNIMKSKLRIEKFERKISSITKMVEDYNKHIENCIESNNEISKEIEYCRKSYEDEQIKINSQYDVTDSKIEVSIDNIKMLPTDVELVDGFIPLRIIKGMEYNKLIGCYIIKNNILDKYYVGQSKDIIKRLKQHFNDTIPKNIIFAEDYYSITEDKRNDLFSVKIIKLITKDEMDRTEKNLIEEYHSWFDGYNKTSGNS